MKETASERRLAENEAVFRKLNEQVNSGFEETNRLAVEDHQPEYMVSYAEPLEFYCECADEKCAAKVRISLNDYKRIHTNRNRFVIVPGHEVGSVEVVVSENPGYFVVEKIVTPPENPQKLHPTSIDND